ncbi:MAG: amidophosphoribosyltransferase [Treponema sp.]
MSGICGVFSSNEDNDIVDLIQYGLYAVQHRGQEGCGIVTLGTDRVYELKRRRGLLSEVITQEVVNDIKGFAGVGMVKYGFSHHIKYDPIMPYIYDTKEGSSIIALDGSIFNEDFCITELIEKITAGGEELTAYIASLKGLFCIIYISKDKMAVIRDQHGVKPLCIGKVQDAVIAVSESCALDAMGAEFIKDIAPGEIYIQSKDGAQSLFCPHTEPKLCLFEMIYIARPDSYIDGISVYQARYAMGRKLYEEYPTKADIVVGAPDSGLIAAKGYAAAAGIPFVDGILRNRYIQRTFIKPTQKERQEHVNIKLNALRANISGKELILVDDSIVRGTTIKRTIKILKDAGARNIHVRIAAPPVTHSEKYSIDLPDKEKLIAHNKTAAEIREELDCASLYYLSLDGLKGCCGNKGYYDTYFTGTNPWQSEG